MEAIKYPFLDLGKVNEPYMDGIREAVERGVCSGRYIGGAEVEAFERRLGEMAGVAYVVGVSNGLDALRLILRGYVELGVMKAGDEVIVPANTYVASVLAVSDAGLVPVLVDASEETSNIDPLLIEDAVTERTRAIMTVHLYGRVSWGGEIKDIARRHGLKIIEDNAQAIGAMSACRGLYGGYATGGLGDAAGFSFYPTKNVGALGDAGAVATHDKELADAVMALANYGSNRRYHNIYQGFNCRMDPIQAAVVAYKLGFATREGEERRGLAGIYCTHITNPKIRLPRLEEGHVFHQFVVHVEDREAFTRYLSANGVGWDVHYAVPPHRQPCYADMLGKRYSGVLEVTERLARRCVSLPITRCTSVEDAIAISEIINAF